MKVKKVFYDGYIPVANKSKDFLKKILYPPGW